MNYDHPFTPSQTDPGNCDVCHFFHQTTIELNGVPVDPEADQAASEMS